MADPNAGNWQGRVGPVAASTDEVKKLRAEKRKKQLDSLRDQRRKKLSEAGNPYLSMGGRR